MVHGQRAIMLKLFGMFSHPRRGERCQVCRQGRIKDHPGASSRMRKLEVRRMEKLARRLRWLRATIRAIANDWMMNCRKVDTNLVCASGFQLHFE